MRANGEPGVAIVGGGLAGFTAFLDAPPCRRARRDRLRRRTGSHRSIRAPRRRDPPARDALRERRPLLPTQLSRPRRAGSDAPPLGRPAPRHRHALGTSQPSTGSSATFASSVEARAGTKPSWEGARRARPAPWTAASSSTGAAPFRDVLLFTGHPGPAIPADRGRFARRPCLRAARVRTCPSLSWVRGLLRPPKRPNALTAGAAVTSVRRRDPLRRPLNVPRPLFSKRGLATFHATSPQPLGPLLLTELSAPSYPNGRGLGRPRRAGSAEGRFRVEDPSRWRRPGDLRDGLPARLPARHPARRAGRRSRTGHSSTAGSSSTSSRACRGSSDASSHAGRWPALLRSGPYPAADTIVGDEVGRTAVRQGRRVVHAEGAASSRGSRPRRSLRCRSLPPTRCCSNTGGRSSSPGSCSPSALPWTRPSTTDCSRTSPGWLAVPLGALELTGTMALAVGYRPPAAACSEHWALFGAALGPPARSWATPVFLSRYLTTREDGGELVLARAARSGRGAGRRRSLCSASPGVTQAALPRPSGRRPSGPAWCSTGRSG